MPTAPAPDTHLNKVCLPSSHSTLGEPGYDPDDCYATGWGKDAFGAEGKSHGALRQVITVLD